MHFIQKWKYLREGNEWWRGRNSIVKFLPTNVEFELCKYGYLVSNGHTNECASIPTPLNLIVT